MVRKQIQGSFLKEITFYVSLLIERRRNALGTLLLTLSWLHQSSRKGYVILARAQVVSFREILREESGCGIASVCRIMGGVGWGGRGQAGPGGPGWMMVAGILRSWHHSRGLISQAMLGLGVQPEDCRSSQSELTFLCFL